MSAAAPAVRTSARRKLFAPTPITATTAEAAAHRVDAAQADFRGSGVMDGGADDDAALAAALSVAESRRSYSLRRRGPALSSSSTPAVAMASSSAKTSSSHSAMNGTPHRRGVRTSAKRSRAHSPSSASEPSDSEQDSDFSDAAAASSGDDSDVFAAEPSSKGKAKAKASSSSSTPNRIRKTVKTEDADLDDSPARASSKPKPKSRSKSTSVSPKKPAPSPFDVSPRKPTKKPIKVNLEPHEAHPAPANWELVYNLLAKQRGKIVAPVDTMGCEENGRQDRRADAWRDAESPEESAKRERLATLVSLMLSSQTKDPVTAEAVYNLQRTLPNGLCLQSLLDADDATISACIAKVGFWRRKTGYLKSAARILASDFGGDVPRTVDELCSLPGVGPKMAFLALSSMGIQVGIGVDTHVHRLTNRLGWHSTKTPEETRLNLQSWLPTPLHAQINRLLVGFGQVICVPVGPRCDLCTLGGTGLCPSERAVDEKSALKRVKVQLLTSDDESDVKHHWVQVQKQDPAAEPSVKVELQVDSSDATMQIADLTHQTEQGQVIIKKEEQDEMRLDAASVEKALEW